MIAKFDQQELITFINQLVYQKTYKMIEQEYYASKAFLEDFVDECSSTRDYFQFIHENLKYFSSNLDQEIQNRRQEARAFKHKSIIGLRSGIDEFITTVKQECIDAISRGIGSAFEELKDIINRVENLRQMNEHLVKEGQKYEIQCKENAKHSAEQMQQINNKIREVEDLESMQRCKTEVLNDKIGSLNKIKTLQTQKTSLKSQLMIARRLYAHHSTLLSNVQALLREDYRFVIKQYEAQFTQIQERIIQLHDKLQEKARRSIYGRVSFERQQIGQIEERVSQVQRLQEFMRNEDQEQSGVPLYRELTSMANPKEVPHRQSYLRSNRSKQSLLSPGLPIRTNSHPQKIEAQNDLNSDGCVQSAPVPESKIETMPKKNMIFKNTESAGIEQFHENLPEQGMELPVLLEAINLDESRQQSRSKEYSAQKVSPKGEAEQQRKEYFIEHVESVPQLQMQQEIQKGEQVIVIESEIQQRQANEQSPKQQIIDDFHCNEQIGGTDQLAHQNKKKDNKKSNKKNKSKSKSKK